MNAWLLSEEGMLLPNVPYVRRELRPYVVKPYYQIATNLHKLHKFTTLRRRFMKRSVLRDVYFVPARATYRLQVPNCMPEVDGIHAQEVLMLNDNFFHMHGVPM